MILALDFLSEEKPHISDSTRGIHLDDLDASGEE